MAQLLLTMAIIIASVSSNSFLNISNATYNATVTTTTKVSISTTSFYEYTKAQSLKDKIFKYTLQQPYLYISISVLSVIFICIIICCIVLCRRSIRQRRLSEPPKPYEFEMTLTGNSLGAHSKKHSLKVIPQLTPDNSGNDLDDGEDDIEQEDEESKQQEFQQEHEEEEEEEETETKTLNDNETENKEEINVQNTQLRNNFMSFSSREYENEWYDGTLTMVDGVNVLKQPQSIGVNYGMYDNEESMTEHLRKEIDVKLQNTNRTQLKKLSNILESIEDEEIKEDYENKIYNNENEGYEWIIETLMKINKSNWETLLNTFKENKVTDDRLKDVRENDWKDLIPAIGIRNEFRKLYEATEDST